MTVTTVGSGIQAVADVPEPVLRLVPEPEPESDAAYEVYQPEAFTKAEDPSSILDQIRAEMRHEFAAAVADVERRLGQARELEMSAASGVYASPRSIHTEDLNINRHLLDGYLVTANSPSAGFIAWSSLHVVLLGVDYTVTNANTNKKYAWFIKPASGTSVTLSVGDTLPTLGPQDALIFVNNGGVPISALETSISYAVGPGVIGSAQLDTATSNLLSTLQSNDIALQSAIDGSIVTYYQNDPPWPAGSPSPSGGNINQGDVWYDANDNGAYRWTGTSGTPANTWQRIADTDNSALAGKIDTKVTTYIANNSPGPTAPAGGFTAGDLWMVTDQGNLLKRWSGSTWVSLTLGDGAIGSGISGAKIGSGINASNLTTGTVAGTLVGTGVNASNVTTGTLAGARVGTGVSASNVTTGTLSGSLVGTGVSASNVTTGTLSGSLVGGGINGGNITQNTVTNTQIGPNAVQPVNINAAFHLLY